MDRQRKTQYSVKWTRANCTDYEISDSLVILQPSNWNLILFRHIYSDADTIMVQSPHCIDDTSIEAPSLHYGVRWLKEIHPPALTITVCHQGKLFVKSSWGYGFTSGVVWSSSLLWDHGTTGITYVHERFPPVHSLITSWSAYVLKIDHATDLWWFEQRYKAFQHSSLIQIHFDCIQNDKMAVYDWMIGIRRLCSACPAVSRLSVVLYKSKRVLNETDLKPIAF